MVKWGEIKKHKFFVVVFAPIVMLCGIGLGRHLYSMANALYDMVDRNMWINLIRANRHLAEADRVLAEADKFFDEIDREQNFYQVFSTIAGTIDGSTIGYCGAMRELDGRLLWNSPENHLLAAYWDENDAERGEQFRDQSIQYVMPPDWTNDLKNVWVDREKLAEYVDIAIKDNAKIGNELMRVKRVCGYDSEGRPEIDLSAMANVVRCYWCARMVRCAEKGELEVAMNEMCALIDMAKAITCGGKTEKELGFAKVLLQNARECLWVILANIEGDYEVYYPYMVKMIRVSLGPFRVARPPKERTALTETLHEIDILRKEWRNEIEDFMREEEYWRERSRYYQEIIESSKKELNSLKEELEKSKADYKRKAISPD
jgi:hypothetical protein